MTDDATSVSRFDLDRLTEWLLSATPDVAATGDGQQWLGILDVLSTHLYAAATDGESRDWRRISRAYLVALNRVTATLWADRPTEPVIHQLNLIEVLTRTVPVDREAELLAPGRAAALFFGSVPFEPEEAARLAAHDRQSIGLHDLKRLRWTAQMARPMVRLKPRLPHDVIERFQPWEALLPRLP